MVAQKEGPSFRLVRSFEYLGGFYPFLERRFALRYSGELTLAAMYLRRVRVISPTHKRTEGRASVWGSEFTSKEAALQGGSSRNRC